MADRSAWWRTGAGIAAWMVLTVATAAVAWTAVRVVAEPGNGPVPVAVPAPPRTTGATPTSGTTATSETTTTSQLTPSPSSDSTSQTGDEESSPGTASRVLASAGGTVSVTCTGSSSIRLIYATSATGWQQTVEESGPDEVEVEFVRGDDDDLRTRARCDGGSIEGETE